MLKFFKGKDKGNVIYVTLPKRCHTTKQQELSRPRVFSTMQILASHRLGSVTPFPIWCNAPDMV